MVHRALVCFILDIFVFENSNGDSDEERISIKYLIEGSMDENVQNLLFHLKKERPKIENIFC